MEQDLEHAEQEVMEQQVIEPEVIEQEAEESDFMVNMLMPLRGAYAGVIFSPLSGWTQLCFWLNLMA